MKATRTVLLMVFAVGVVTQAHAMRWYSPHTGRWFSRDPIEERAFSIQHGNESVPRLWWDLKSDTEEETRGDVSLSAFVANEPIAFVDGLGLYRIIGDRDIWPDKCEMVVIYGHGSRKSATWNWHMKNSPSAGTAVMCFPKENMNGLVEDNNLWPEAEDISELVWWLPLGQVRHGPPVDTVSPVPRDKYNRINANAAMYRQVLPRGATKLDAFCKCGCAQVTVTLIRVRKDGTIVPNPTGKSDDPGWPNIPSTTFSCPSIR